MGGDGDSEHTRSLREAYAGKKYFFFKKDLGDRREKAPAVNF